MATERNSSEPDPEIGAINTVHDAIKELERAGQIRVLQYVSSKLGLCDVAGWLGAPQEGRQSGSEQRTEKASSTRPELTAEPAPECADGISPIAQKWMQRNALKPAELEKLFSLGGDEIDVIAHSVPGRSKKTRTGNVILLKGVAAYLGSGAARISHQQIKETCLHYDAYDSPNFAKYLKDLASVVSGSKDAGYTLTARGLAAATELVKQMAKGNAEQSSLP